MMPEPIQLADGGTLHYDEAFLPRAAADELLQALKTQTPWKQEISAFGHPFPRLTAWYADPGLTYSYSGVTHQGLPWTPALAEVRRKVESSAGASFNSLLLNYYRDGKDSIGFHADDEPELGANPVVPSISLGAVREFILRHKKGKAKGQLKLLLAHGSLLLMGGTCQRFWVHSVPKARGDVGERINLTFRHILR